MDQASFKLPEVCDLPPSSSSAGIKATHCHTSPIIKIRIKEAVIFDVQSSRAVRITWQIAVVKLIQLANSLFYHKFWHCGKAQTLFLVLKAVGGVREFRKDSYQT